MNDRENSTKEIARLAVEIAASLYGAIPNIHPFQSARSRVFRLDFDAGLDSKILKIARIGNEGDILREQQILPALLLRGFEVPRIEHTQATADFGVAFTILPFVEGGPIDAVKRMAPANARATYEHLGHFLARLSVLDAQAIPGGRTNSEVYDQVAANRREGEAHLGIHLRFTPRLMELLHLGCDLRQDTSGFAHWDGPQVITDGLHTFTVIDWGGAGAGHRLVDLSAFLMGHGYGVYSDARDGHPIYTGWNEAVLYGYLGGRHMTAEVRRKLHFMGASQGILDAMAMAHFKHRGAEDFLTYIEEVDAAFLSVS